MIYGLFVRFRLANTGDVFCLYQGFVKDNDAVKHDFNLSKIYDQGIVMICLLNIFRQLKNIVARNAVELLSRNSVFVFYEISSKLVVIAAVCVFIFLYQFRLCFCELSLICYVQGSDQEVSMYWGIDARFNLVVSSYENVVEKACGCVQTFLKGTQKLRLCSLDLDFAIVQFLVMFINSSVQLLKN